MMTRVFAVQSGCRRGGAVRKPRSLLPAKMDEYPAEVLGVLLDSVIQGLDVLAIEKAQYMLLELPGALARNNLDEWCLRPGGLVEDVLQGLVDVPAAVVDIVQIEL